jgi:hypothetical protein
MNANRDKVVTATELLMRVPVVVNEWNGMLVTFSILEIQGWFK